METKSKNRRKILRAVGLLLLTLTLLLSSALPSAAYENKSDGEVVIASRFGELIFGKKEDKREDTLMLCPSGDVFGARISGAGVRVSRVLTESEGGLCEGDRIERINGREVNSVDEAREILSGAKDEARVAILRGGKSMTLAIPLSDTDEFRLGVLMSDSAAGIGTVTYINPADASFGGLGHGICDQDSGKLLPMTDGVCTGVILGGASRGEGGKPGELRGILTHDTLGDIRKNTRVGVFGTLNGEGLKKKQMDEPIPVAARDEVKEGKAEIISTVKGGKRARYEVELFDIDYASDGSKSFKIKVTDEALIALTGGIVRGMSGSPIIQDGKLVGAVTHVLIANPTEGYGIFIENMLAAAQNQVIPKAA